jgi:GT2 family glycosyltransferase
MNFNVEPQIDVSIIYVNYNTFNLLCNSIDSVLTLTYSIRYEIIIVDNSSDDNSCEALLAKYGLKIKLLPLTSNIGFGRANNEGVHLAKGRNIFFLNPDTVLLNNAIKILSDYLDSHHNTGIAGGNLYDCKQDPSYSFRHFSPGVFWEFNDLLFSLPEKILFGKNKHFNNTLKPVNVAYITGADLMISKSLFEQVGLFSKEYFLYFEETDLAYKIRKLNLRIMNVPDAKVIHLEGESFGNEAARYCHYLAGKLIFYRKNLGKLTRTLLYFLIMLTVYSRMTIFTLLMNKTKLERWKMLGKTFLELKSEMKLKPSND